jgi:hypothetical protein
MTFVAHGPAHFAVCWLSLSHGGMQCLSSAIDNIFLPHSQQPYTIRTSFTNYDARALKASNKSITVVTTNDVDELENSSDELSFSGLLSLKSYDEKIFLCLCFRRYTSL